MATNSTVALLPQDYFSTTLSSSITSTDTTISLASLPTATEGFLVIDPDNSSKEIIFYNAKGGSSVTVPSTGDRGRGGTTAVSHSSGATVKMMVTSDYYKELQNGNANIGLQNYFNNSFADFVESGCVWSGDAYASTKAASMTSGVVMINGIRYTVAAVTARTFTASKDTYVDILATAPNTGTVVYTEVTNNAASPALASNSIRIAIIVTGASNIASAASINQGEPNKTVPTTCNLYQSGLDSLGNPICPKSSVFGTKYQPQIYINNNATFPVIASASYTDITGSSMSITLLATSKLVITSSVAYNFTGAPSVTSFANIMVDGSSVGESRIDIGVNAGSVTHIVPAITTHAAGTFTVKMQGKVSAGSIQLFQQTMKIEVYNV